MRRWSFKIFFGQAGIAELEGTDEPQLRQSASLQKASQPIEPQDLCLDDQTRKADGKISEPELITENNHTMQDSKQLHKQLKTLKAKDKRRMKALKKQKGINHNLRIELGAAETQSARIQSILQRTKQELVDREGELKEFEYNLTQERNFLSSKEAQTLQQILEISYAEIAGYQARLSQQQRNNEELQEMRMKLAAVQQDLSACKDDLFRLQPVNQIPDSEITKDFENLCQYIIHWIDAEVLGFARKYPEADPENIFSIADGKEASVFLEAYPGGGEYLARCLIHQFLSHNMFQGQYFFGLKGFAVDVLRSAEAGMAKLDPPRDPETIATWRSETLRALAVTGDFEKSTTNVLQKTHDDLCRTLSQTFPILFGNQDGKAKFYREIMIPSARLARKIQSSRVMYTFPMTAECFPTFPVSPEHMKIYHIVDFKTGKALRNDSTVKLDDNGDAGKCMLILEPGICRKKSGKESQLRRPTFLVDFKFPVAKRSQRQT